LRGSTSSGGKKSPSGSLRKEKSKRRKDKKKSSSKGSLRLSPSKADKKKKEKRSILGRWGTSHTSVSNLDEEIAQKIAKEDPLENLRNTKSASVVISTVSDGSGEIELIGRVDKNAKPTKAHLNRGLHGSKSMTVLNPNVVSKRSSITSISYDDDELPATKSTSGNLRRKNKEKRSSLIIGALSFGGSKKNLNM